MVREWTRELYDERGRASIDPVVFFKLQFVMFLDGIRSERKLIETAWGRGRTANYHALLTTAAILLWL